MNRTRMYKQLLASLWLGSLMLVAAVQAQVGGRAVFDFLRLHTSARQTALGGAYISVQNTDNALALMNPALLNPDMHQKAYASWIDFLGNTNYGTVGYSRHYPQLGTVQLGIRYLGYGSFTEADAFGNRTGSFSAGDVALNAGWGRQVAENLSVGANLKVINSHLYTYSSWGLAMDIGAYYDYKKWDVQIGAVAQNIGRQLNPYVAGSTTEPLPFDLQLGITKRIPHTPMRFTLTGHDLHRPQLVNQDAEGEELDLEGNPVKDKTSTADEVFRHLTFGLEFLLNKNLHLRTGYNHQRRRELQSPENNGLNLNGFSLGLGLRINRFYLDYGFASYHAVGGVHHFQISTLLNTFQRGWQYDPAAYDYNYN
ncbi:MAG: type IX secretion system protein PorQ [Bacteroidetes bacterium]|nr:type IX secretion system protein PorQ [Bacteroidota bacterium]